MFTPSRTCVRQWRRVALSRVEEKSRASHWTPGPVSPRRKAGLGERLLPDRDAVEDGLSFAPAVMAIGETFGIVVREALAKLGQGHRFGVEQVDGETGHRPPTRSR